MDYPQKLTDRVTLLGNIYFSVYLVQGEHYSALIEPGISSTAKRITNQLENLNVDPASVHDLILMHAHADHVTGAPILKKEMPQLRVKSSSETDNLLQKKKIQDFFLKDDTDIERNLEDLRAPIFPCTKPFFLEGLVDETITPKQVLMIDDYPLEILDAPGHCMGGIALWQPEDRILFCSDYLGFRMPSGTFVTNFYVDYDDYMNTFDRLCRLEPQWICPGHCGAFSGEDVIRYMEGSLAEIKRVHEYVTENAESPANLEQFKKSLFKRYYVDEATMFSEAGTRYCMDLLVRRVLESNPGNKPEQTCLE